MEFLVEFEVNIPDGTPDSEVKRRDDAEAGAAARLVEQGYLERVWKKRVSGNRMNVLGLVSRQRNTARRFPRIASARRMDARNGDASGTTRQRPGATRCLQRVIPSESAVRPVVYRLDETIGQPQEFGETAEGHRRIVPLTGGTFRAGNEGHTAAGRQRRLADPAAGRHRTRRHPLHVAD